MLGRWKLCEEKVRSIREFKFLASFSCVANIEVTLKVLEETMESKCLTVRNGQRRRSVCLEIFGIPPFAWCRPNFEFAVAQIGRLAWLDPEVEEGVELELAKF